MAEETKVPNPDGRKGCPDHQNLITRIALFLLSLGFRTVKEGKIKLPTEKKRYADIVAFNDDGSIAEIHQIGVNNKGGDPVKRERDAIDDIEGATGIKVEFHAYKTLILIVGLLLGGLLIYAFTSKHIAENQDYSFFVGTYTDSTSQGIYKFSLQKDGTLKRIGLAAKCIDPSFLAYSADRKFLVAVNEINKNGAGTVESYQIQDDSLQFISRSSSGGAHPCFVAVNKAGFVLTANYTGGNVGLLRLNTNGKLSDLLYLEQHTGKGTTDRQKEPHAHSAWFEPTGNGVVAVDLGTNELWLSQLDTLKQKLTASKPNKLKMSDGDGPRHLAFHPKGGWMYVINELNCTVTLMRKTKSGYLKSFTFSTLPQNFTLPNTCADIHISADGKFLYASNRGHNSIVIFSVDPDNGTLRLLANESTLGKGPRNFALSPDENYLLVANQLTRNIVSFKRDKTTGLLKFVGQIDAPTPVCILF